MKRLMHMLGICLLLSVNPALAQQNERDAYLKAARLDDAAARIEALERFLQQYPNGQFAVSAYSILFSDYLALQQTQKAIQAATRALRIAPESYHGSIYNSLAWELAKANVALDSALVYAQRAVAWANKQDVRTRGMVLDTYAFVLFQRGDSRRAEEAQLQALEGHEREGQYRYRLALYQHANGKLQEAMTNLARAVLYGHSEGLDLFESWSADVRMKKEIAEKAAAEYAAQTQAGEAERMTRTALLFAAMNVNLEQAERLAQQALQAAESVDVRLLALQSLARIKTRMGDRAGALAYLEQGREIASLFSSDFWLLLGEMYEKAGRKRDALEVYLQGVLGYEFPEVKKRLTALYREMHGSEAGLEDLISKKKAALESFRPQGHYRSDRATGHVVLAELFTGAQCGPCQAADYAFDALKEYFSRDQLAIVEYHLHIPGPDPMTNGDTEARAKLYGVRSTPTAIFNGRQIIRGGGPKVATANRFHVYRYAIEKALAQPPAVSIALDAVHEDSLIRISTVITPKSGNPAADSLRLHVALVENKIAYTGANGVDHHLFVVRKLLCGAAGKPVLWKGKSAREKLSVSLREVERSVRRYLDNFAQNPPSRYRNFKGWKNPPVQLDRTNLAVVAWVQNAGNRGILQAAYADLSPAALRGQ